MLMAWLKKKFDFFPQYVNQETADYGTEHDNNEIIQRTAFMPGFFHGLRSMWLFRSPFIAHTLGLIIGMGIFRLIRPLL